MGFIYKITNTIDNMSYIGQTIHTIQERFKDHCKPSSNCRYLKNAIKKYGKDNFRIELICTCVNEELNEKEKYYIEHLDRRAFQMGTFSPFA
jgi:group I intron endonuclease